MTASWVPMRALVKRAVGGGWGRNSAEVGTEQVAVIRGADFPAVAHGDTSRVPIRWEAARKIPQRKLQVGDIILEISGGTSGRPTGRTVFVSERLLDGLSHDVIPASFCRLVRIDKELADPHFVYWWLQGMYAEGRTWSYQNRSTGIANFQFEHFLDTEKVRLPPRPVQREIAATLGVLDAKIESNRRAVSILQTLIRTLFQKWRSTSPAEHVTTFGEFADVYGGATPKTGVPDYWSGDIAWATPTDITALEAPYLYSTTRTISESGLASMSAKLQPVGTILMTSRATIGAFAVNEVPTATNQGFIAVRPRQAVHRWFLLEEMRSRVPEMLDRANGSTFMELSRGSFKSMPIGIPSDSAITELHGLLDPSHSRSSQLDLECAKLAAARQAVLPELLSGRFHVGDVQGVMS